MSKNTILTLVFGGVIGGFVFMGIGMTTGVVVSSGLAHSNAKRLSDQAVLDQLVPICLHQTNGGAGHATELAAMRALQPWKREEFVRQQGWATMPGGDAPVSGVARECAERLSKADS